MDFMTDSIILLSVIWHENFTLVSPAPKLLFKIIFPKRMLRELLYILKNTSPVIFLSIMRMSKKEMHWFIDFNFIDEPVF